MTNIPSKILKGKNCIITGATGGLGEQLAIQMSLSNCNLFLTSKTKTKLINLAKKIKKLNPKIQIFYQFGNLNNSKDVLKIIDRCKRKFSHIDILINNAGVFHVKFLEKTTLEDFENCFSINVKAPFLFSKAFSKEMKKNHWGRIVNIGSSSAYEGFKETSIYCASKHALLGLSRSLNDELRGENVKVFCISPGSIKTKNG